MGWALESICIGSPVRGLRPIDALRRVGPNKVGPNLWDVVDRAHGGVASFAYSDAMKAKSAEPWSFEALNAFIKSPKEGVPGTKMGFGGLKKDQDRANLLAYLATLSDAPKPFPAP